MKRNIIIYLIIVLFSCMTFNSCRMISDNTGSTSATKIEIVEDLADIEFISSHLASISTSDSDFYVPRPTSFSGPSRIQSTGKRNIQTYRAQTALLKGGKSFGQINSAVYTLDFFRFPSGLAENTHHLISLGKLII